MSVAPAPRASRPLRLAVLLSALAAALPVPAAAQAAGDEEPEAEESAPEPTADETEEAASTGGAPPAGDAEVDLGALRREYLALRDRLFRSRARAQAVASALYSTELRVHLDFPRDRFVTPTRAAIRLNGATIYEDTEARIASDRAPRFEGFIAPGPHKLTIRVEAASRDDARFETASEHTFTVVAPRGHRVTIRAVAGDEGNIGYEWETSRSGSYELELNVDVAAEPREASEES